MDKKIRLAIAIENAMRLKGISRKEFADIMLVQPSIVTRWLSGKHNFTIETLFKIEECLEIQILYIMGR